MDESDSEGYGYSWDVRMKTEYRYIHFECVGETAKTSRWYIYNNRSHSYLGEIKWYGCWRCYCFYPASDTIFNDNCMRDIIDFINQLKNERK
jgi:hypothetical protein